MIAITLVKQTEDSVSYYALLNRKEQLPIWLILCLRKLV